MHALTTCWAPPSRIQRCSPCHADTGTVLQAIPTTPGHAWKWAGPISHSATTAAPGANLKPAETQPPPPHCATINAYLRKSTNASAPPKHGSVATLESAIGRDTNINFATSKSTVYVPIF